MDNAQEKQFRQFYNEHLQTVYRVCFMYMKNQYDAEDAVQTVFTKLLEKKPTFENEYQEKAWLVITASNVCKSLLRRHSRKDISIDELGGELPSCGSEDRELLREILSLPDKYKNTVYLYYYEGYSCAEISRMLRTKESTVRSNLYRGREKLKNYIGGNSDEK